MNRHGFHFFSTACGALHDSGGVLSSLTPHILFFRFYEIIFRFLRWCRIFGFQVNFLIQKERVRERERVEIFEKRKKRKKNVEAIEREIRENGKVDTVL